MSLEDLVQMIVNLDNERIGADAYGASASEGVKRIKALLKQ